MHDAFRQLIANLQSIKITEKDEGIYLMDSFPIMLAQHHHAYTAKIVPGIAHIGDCSAKTVHYYGVKAPIVARVNA